MQNDVPLFFSFLFDSKCSQKNLNFEFFWKFGKSFFRKQGICNMNFYYYCNFVNFCTKNNIPWKGILPFGLNISLQNSCSWALHTADQTQNMLESPHVVTFILQENIWGVNPSLILPIMKKTPWGAYLELDELDCIAVYKAHVKSSMNPDWVDWTFRS